MGNVKTDGVNSLITPSDATNGTNMSISSSLADLSFVPQESLAEGKVLTGREVQTSAEGRSQPIGNGESGATSSLPEDSVRLNSEQQWNADLVEVKGLLMPKGERIATSSDSDNEDELEFQKTALRLNKALASSVKGMASKEIKDVFLGGTESVRALKTGVCRLLDNTKGAIDLLAKHYEEKVKGQESTIKDLESKIENLRSEISKREQELNLSGGADSLDTSDLWNTEIAEKQTALINVRREFQDACDKLEQITGGIKESLAEVLNLANRLAKGACGGFGDVDPVSTNVKKEIYVSKLLSEVKGHIDNVKSQVEKFDPNRSDAKMGDLLKCSQMLSSPLLMASDVRKVIEKSFGKELAEKFVDQAIQGQCTAAEKTAWAKAFEVCDKVRKGPIFCEYELHDVWESFSDFISEKINESSISEDDKQKISSEFRASMEKVNQELEEVGQKDWGLRGRLRAVPKGGKYARPARDVVTKDPKDPKKKIRYKSEGGFVTMPYSKGGDADKDLSCKLMGFSAEDYHRLFGDAPAGGAPSQIAIRDSVPKFLLNMLNFEGGFSNIPKELGIKPKDLIQDFLASIGENEKLKGLSYCLKMDGKKIEARPSFAALMLDNHLPTICSCSGTTTEIVAHLLKIDREDTEAALKNLREVAQNNGTPPNEQLKKVFTTTTLFMQSGRFHSAAEVLIGMYGMSCAIGEQTTDVDQTTGEIRVLMEKLSKEPGIFFVDNGKA